ncbi:hypothetical protein EBU99_14530, partial [bacterium]|nr:hypothetical protein [bacterium]
MFELEMRDLDKKREMHKQKDINIDVLGESLFKAVIKFREVVHDYCDNDNLKDMASILINTITKAANITNDEKASGQKFRCELLFDTFDQEIEKLKEYAVGKFNIINGSSNFKELFTTENDKMKIAKLIEISESLMNLLQCMQEQNVKLCNISGKNNIRGGVKIAINTVANEMHQLIFKKPYSFKSHESFPGVPMTIDQNESVDQKEQVGEKNKRRVPIAQRILFAKPLQPQMVYNLDEHNHDVNYHNERKRRHDDDDDNQCAKRFKSSTDSTYASDKIKHYQHDHYGGDHDHYGVCDDVCDDVYYGAGMNKDIKKFKDDQDSSRYLSDNVGGFRESYSSKEKFNPFAQNMTSFTKSYFKQGPYGDRGYFLEFLKKSDEIKPSVCQTCGYHIHGKLSRMYFCSDRCSSKAFKSVVSVNVVPLGMNPETVPCMYMARDKNYVTHDENIILLEFPGGKHSCDDPFETGIRELSQVFGVLLEKGDITRTLRIFWRNCDE